MRQNDGSEILGPGDPRNVAIGIIHVTPGDDRQSILTAITTQDRLGRAHLILDLPSQNRAFKAAVDFEGLRQFASELNAELLLVLPQRSRLMNFAEKQGFTVYGTLEELFADQFPPEEPAGQIVDADPPTEGGASPADAQPLAEVPEPPTVPLPATTLPVANQVSPAPTVPVDAPLPITYASPARTVSPNAPDAEEEEPEALPPTQQLQPALPPRSYLPVPVASGGALVDPNATPPAFYGATPTRWPLRRRLLVTGAILLLVIVLGIVLFRPVADLFFPPTAAVTITPASQVLDHSYAMMAVLGTPNPSNNQVDARALYATSPSQSQTVKATGQGTTPGQPAQGVLTFYNSSTSQQQIAAGTVIVDANGIAVVNDDPLTLPGLLNPQQGIVGVEDAAHTVNVGSNQNIPANDFNATPCCGGSVYVTNQTAFTGGTDAQSFVYVQQSDITTVAQTLGTALAAQAKAALQRQIRANEALAGEPHCVPLVQSDAQAGQQASSVTVSVTSTCFGEVYDLQAVQTLAAHNLTLVATQKLGTAYAPVGRIRASVTHAMVDAHGTILLTVNTAGVWVYQFSSAQLRHLASLIAGKSSQDARATLLSQPGVAGVSILLTGVDTTEVPGDSSKITVNASAVSGLP